MARLSREQSRQRTRGALLRSARVEFIERGYAAASVERIAERAGFSRGAFYANFADKADLFLAVVEHAGGDRFTELGDRMARTPDADKLGAIEQWFTGITGDHRLDLALWEFWPVAARDAALRHRLAEHERGRHDAIASMVEQYCHAAGIELPIPVARFATLLLALGEGLDRLTRLDDDAAPPELLPLGAAALWFGIAQATALPAEQ